MAQGPGMLSRRQLVLAHDLLMVGAAWLLSFLVRTDFHIADFPTEPAFQALPLVMGIQGLLLWRTGLYRGVWRFASVPDAWNIVRAALLGALAVATALFLVNRLEGIPRTALVLYPLFLILLLSGPRLFFRLMRDTWPNLAHGARGDRVLILGAGASGEMLARDLKTEGPYEVVGFLDDKPSLQGAKIRGHPVLGRIEDLLLVVDRWGVNLIVIAMPSASNQEMQRAVELCERSGVRFRTLPRMQDLLSGKARFTDLQEVDIEDLLGRDPVQLDREAIGAGLSGKTVFVSGGGGSIGGELCRQIAAYGPRRLVILEACEYNLYRIERELSGQFPDLELVPTLTDVRDEGAVEGMFADYRPDTVFHAAAYKHVPLLEAQSREAIRNNVFGTRNMACAADAFGADKFVLISTDKAVNPTNIMGASKRVAEIFCQNLDARSATRFVTVRFGNVLDSAGSVVPVFREQIARGGPVTVTHPDITRYFMTIPEACQLILQAESMGEGGEIFVLEMGEPVPIRYLAEQMIRLSGKEPGRDIEISYTGLRPGEKLYEELFHDAESLQPTAHHKVLQAQYREVDWEHLNRILEAMAAACDREGADLRELVRELAPEYQPQQPEQEARAAAGKVVALRTAEG
ncbi:MAG: polysaccharide biosynthesis protein [Thiohalorhabdus sp.]|uniref:polysaccharide biosynthesis protein n=1 Tax=Thiohalorhabdus sp. TaxID=3094134 RepID=UPI00397F7E88